MNAKHILFILVVLITIDSALSVTTTTFYNGSDSLRYVSLSYNVTATAQLYIPINTTVNKAQINYSFYTSGQQTILCDQEFANLTTCGQASPGAYVVSAGLLTAVYVKPTNALNTSSWLVRHGNGASTQTQYDIPSSCWDYSATDITFRVYSLYDEAGLTSRSECRNGSSSYYVFATKTSAYTGAAYYASVPSNLIDGDWDTQATYMTVSGETVDWNQNALPGDQGQANVYEEAMRWVLLNSTQSRALVTSNSYVYLDVSTNGTGTITLNSTHIGQNTNNLYPINITVYAGTLNLSNVINSYSKNLIVNFTALTSGEVWFVNYSKYTFNGTGIRLNADDFRSAPLINIFYNNFNQTIVYRPDYSTYYNDYINATVVSSLLTTAVDVWVTDGWSPISGATVKVYKGYKDTLIDQKVTNVDGEATVNMNTDQTYYVCAEKEGYTQIEISCKAILDLDETYLLVLHKASVPMPNPPAPTPVTPTVNATPRINITLVADQFTTTRDRNIGVFAIIILAIIMAVIMENRIQGYGKVTFAIVMLLFSSVFHILILPGLIISVYMILPFVRRFTG